MEIKKTIAESTASEITKIIIALLLPLLLGLALALVPQARDHILPVLPKPLLAVLVGLSLSLNLALFLYVLHLRKSLASALTPRFGVLWSREQIPHCPACSKPLGPYFQRAVVSEGAGPWGFRCIQCKEFISMYDDAGRVLELREAKSLLSSQQTLLTSAQIESPLDATEIMILRLTAASKEPSMWPTTIADITGLHIHAVKFHVHKLIEAGHLEGRSEVFNLTHKGREYLMAKKLLD